MSGLDPAHPPLPVVVVAGFLGAGKTTLVNHLLRSCPDRRLGVLVNDFGDVAIDADLIVAKSEDVLTLANGCICCSLRGDLTSKVMKLAEGTDPETPRPEHLIIEASGVSEPGAIVSALLDLERYQLIRLDAVVAVVDAEGYAELEGEPARLAQRQVTAADLVVLGKTDLATANQRAATEAKLDAQSAAKRWTAVQGEVPPEVILGFEGAPEQGAERARRLELLDGSGAAETMWVTGRFETQAALDFRALVGVLKALPESVYRAKGFIHAVERPGRKLAVHLAGRRVQVRTVGSWNDAEPYSQLVFIGTEWPSDLQARLSDCERAAR